MTKYQARFLPNSDGEPEWAILPYEAYQELLQAAQSSGKPGPEVSPVDEGVSPKVAEALPEQEELTLEQVQNIRKDKGMTPEAMAREVGISPLYYAQIEAGEREVSPAIMGAIQRAFKRL